MKKNFLFMMVLLFISGSAFAQTVDTVAILSPSMHKTIKTVVVLPASYDKSPDKKYPVVYLLHGHGGNYAVYVNQTRPELPQDVSQMECIAVCPDGGKNSWYWDSPADPKNRYETFVAEELVKYIDEHYRTIADRTGRAITGFSMGGHGALWLAFRHPETFGACGSMSGGVDIRPFPDQWDMKQWLGEYSKYPKVWNDHTVITQLYRLRPEPHVQGGRGNDWLMKSAEGRPAIIIDCGIDDFFYDVNVALHEAMQHNNIAHTFITRPGVPMTICTPSFRERICLTISWPPYTGSTFTPCMYLARRRISSATWIASSLVGQRAMAWSFLFLGSIFSSRGMPKAAVFPVPVWAWPIMSSPSLWMGIAWAWMGDGSSNPISPMARRILLFSSISSNRIIQ